jgi:hypothetical protein
MSLTVNAEPASTKVDAAVAGAVHSADHWQFLRALT